METGKTDNKINSEENLADRSNTYRLGHDSINQLLVRYAIPAIVGTMVMSLYNIVDRIYIGQGVGPEAISGLALTFPVMTLSAAFGMLIGAGSAARISILLGKGEVNMAEKVLGNALVLTFIIASTYSIVNYIWMDKILLAYGGTSVTIPYAEEYLKIIIIFTILNNLSFGFNNMMRASGYPKKAMFTMLISAFANVILDPIFIFGFDMGIRGAAIATVISMAITAAWVMIHFSNPHHTISFHRFSFHLERRIILSIIAIGMSPFLTNLTGSVVNVFFNRSLVRYGGDLAIGAFGIINSFSMLVVMLIVGLCQGMQPIVGYNYGAGHLHRVESAFRRTALIATVITTLGFAAAFFFPEAIVRAFTTDEELTAIAARGLRLMLCAFSIVGFQIVTTNFFQSLGMAWKAIFLSLSRQVLFLLPMLWLLPRFLQLDGIWYASPIADVVASVIAAVFFIYQWRHIHPAK